MKKNKFIELKTERLFLRKLKESDWKAIFFLRSDKTVNQFVERSSSKSEEEANEFISKINTGIDKKNSFYWAITENGADQMIGSICLWNFSENQKKAEVGFDLNPKFQKKGIMNEALKCIIQFGFETLNLDLLEAYTHIDNQNSRKLLERNNFELVIGKKDEHNQNNVFYDLKND